MGFIIELISVDVEFVCGFITLGTEQDWYYTNIHIFGTFIPPSFPILTSRGPMPRGLGGKPRGFTTEVRVFIIIN